MSSRAAVNLFGKAIRESGQALDRLGLTMARNEIFQSTLSRHRAIMPLGAESEDHPAIHEKDTFVAPTAAVIGGVHMDAGSSVWYGSVLRADQGHAIRIGAHSNVQDRSVFTSDSGAITVGTEVTVGHGVFVEGGVSIGDHCLVGQGSILGTQCSVGAGSIIAAGAVVLPRTAVPAGEMWAGNPAAHVRAVTQEEKNTFPKQAQHYTQLGAEHAKEF